MIRLAIYGAGAFGAALAVAYATAGRDVTLWARSGAAQMAASREVPRLPGTRLPGAVRVTGDPRIDADIALIAVPTQSLGAMIEATRPDAPCLVSCAKGIDMETGLGPTALIRRHAPQRRVGPTHRPELWPWISRRACPRP